MTDESGAIWVTRWIERARPYFGGSAVLAGLCTFGAVPVALNALFFALAGPLPARFAVSHLLASVVTVVGPVGVWYYDRRVFPRFHRETSGLVTDEDALADVVASYRRRFRANFWRVSGPWTALVLAVVLLNRDYFASLGVGVADPAFVVYLAFAVWWGVLTGIGFHGALITVRCIRRVGELRMDIDPLHPDGLGGLSAIGSFAIWTTMLISIGSLTLPLAFTIAAEGSFRPVVYAAVVCYVLAIGLSFVYPTVYVNRRAQELRAEILEEKRRRIRELQGEIGPEAPDEAADTEELARQFEIQTLRDDYRDYEDVNLYPLSVGILTRLVSSVILPLAFTGVEMALNTWF